MVVNLAFIRELVRRFTEDEIPRLSAELAYYFLLSLFPFLLFLMTLLAYLPIPHEDVLALVRQYAPKEALHLIETNVYRLMNEQNGGLLSFSIIAAIWSASNGMSAIMRAFNRAYDVQEDRPFWIVRGLSIVLTLGMIMVIIVALVLPVFGRIIGLVFVLCSRVVATVFECLEYISLGDEFAVIVCCLYCPLLFRAEQTASLRQRRARCAVCHRRLDCGVAGVRVLCQQLCRLHGDVRQPWRDDRVDGLVLFVRHDSCLRRGTQRHV